MQFRSELNRPKPHQYAQGNYKKYMDVYEDVINEKTGKMETIITDKKPIDDMIQEHKDNVTLDSILERYKIDLSKKAITEISEDIMDMTIMPQDPLEAYTMINEAQKNFNETTAEFKNEFNNNFGEYLAGFKNGKTQKVLTEHSKHIVKKEQAIKMQQQAVQQNQNTQTTVQQPTQNINVGGETYNV